MKLKYSSLISLCWLYLIPLGLNAQLISGVVSIPPYSGEEMVATPYDNGYALAGSVNNHISIVKFNATTWAEWSEIVGGNADSIDYPSNIIYTKDSGLAIVGGTTSYGAGQYDIYVSKLDKKGNVQWGRTIGTPNIDQGRSILQTKDGGYVVSGMTEYNSVSGLDIIKLSNTGKLLWSKSYVISSTSGNSALAPTTDGGFISVNGDTNTTTYVTKVLKFDSAGNLKWSKAITNGPQYGHIFITPLRDGNFALVENYMTGYLGTYALNISVIDSSASVLNSLEIGSSFVITASGITSTSSGGFALTGYYCGCYEHCATDMITMAFDSAANQVMNVADYGTVVLYEPTENYNGEAIVANSDSSFNITVAGAGGDYNDAFVKLDKTGNSCITTSGEGYISALTDSTINVTVTQIGVLTIDSGGMVLGPEYIPDSVLCEVLGVQPIPPATDKVDVYPNPTNGTVNIFQNHFAPNEKIEIYNTLGQLVSSSALTGNTTSLNLNAVSGLYLYIIRNETGSIISEGKIVVL